MQKRDVLIGGNHYHVWFGATPLGIGRYDIKNKFGIFTQSYKLKEKEGYKDYFLCGDFWLLATDKEVEEFYKETEEFHNH
jgi:hypothetical protein